MLQFELERDRCDDEGERETERCTCGHDPSEGEGLITRRLELTKKADTPPWKKPPAGKKKTSLTADFVRWAKARAAAAGRKYPNLLDNMAAAKAAGTLNLAG